MTRPTFLVLLGLVLAGLTGLGQVEAQPTGPSFRPTQEEYIVAAGDTLWDISEKIAGSPWFWPLVWSYNPEITNPHWIYPGDLIRFYPSEQALPRLQLIADTRNMPDEDANVDVIAPSSKKQGLAVEEVNPPSKVRSRTRYFVGEFVTEKELQESGVLTNAIDDKILLSVNDEVFLTFPKGHTRQVGDKFAVYRTVRPVDHPVSRSRFGHLTQITGLAVITVNEGDRVSRAKVIAANLEIERGQYLTPHVRNPYVQLDDPVPADRDVQGVIVAVSGLTPRLMGEEDLVFIDKGSKDGLSTGNRLQVLTTRDDLGKRFEPLPGTGVATLQVLETKETSAACLVVDARRELEAGYWVRTILP